MCPIRVGFNKIEIKATGNTPLECHWLWDRGMIKRVLMGPDFWKTVEDMGKVRESSWSRGEFLSWYFEPYAIHALPLLLAAFGDSTPDVREAVS